jgi:DNA-binding transcriptional LysR family regulator
MNLDHLSLFCEVVELGNFSEVAKQRFCNASSVSRTIAQLEEALGITLFYRSTRKVQLTEAGNVYYQSLKKLLPQLELANQQARDVQHALQGTVRITLPNDFAETLVVPHIQNFYQRYPEIKLELILTDDCLDLEQERIDLAIRLGEVQQSNWVAKKLRKIGFVACASPNFAGYKEVDSSHPTSLQEIPCINFLAKSKIPQWRFIAKEASKDSQVVNINQQVYVNSAVAAKQLCLQGLGVAVLPD